MGVSELCLAVLSLAGLRTALGLGLGLGLGSGLGLGLGAAVLAYCEPHEERLRARRTLEALSVVAG